MWNPYPAAPVLPQDSAKFLKQHWEQAPVVFKASAERRALFAGLFNYVELQRLAVICEQEGEPLEFEVDVNAARYVDGKRETPNGEVSGRQWVAAGGRAGRQEAVRGGLILVSQHACACRPTTVGRRCCAQVSGSTQSTTCVVLCAPAAGRCCCNRAPVPAGGLHNAGGRQHSVSCCDCLPALHTHRARLSCKWAFLLLLSTAFAPPTVFLVLPAARCLPAVPPAAALLRGAVASAGRTGAPAGLPGGLQCIPDTQGNSG